MPATTDDAPPRPARRPGAPCGGARRHVTGKGEPVAVGHNVGHNTLSPYG
ncbi:hypothetical protein [Streptomyces noursei]|nr:hypothetical protein [Streptomyces noursei]